MTTMTLSWHYQTEETTYSSYIG